MILFIYCCGHYLLYLGYPNMYENMLEEDLSELIEEYCKLDWKKRSEAAKILGYIKDPNEINN